MNKKKYIYLTIAIILIFIAIIAFFLLRGGKDGFGGGLFPTPTPINPRDIIEGGGAINNPEDQVKQQQSIQVGKLINILPYNGSNFSLFYSFNSNEFILYLNPKASESANKEFNSFLLQNGISDRSWIENLVVTDVKVTPEL